MPVTIKLIFSIMLVITLASCVQVAPQDPVSYQAALDAASEDDFRHRDRERRSAAEAYRASGQQAPNYHYHQHSNNYVGW